MRKSAKAKFIYLKRSINLIDTQLSNQRREKKRKKNPTNTNIRNERMDITGGSQILKYDEIIS